MQFEEFIAAVGTAANAMGVGSRPVAAGATATWSERGRSVDVAVLAPRNVSVALQTPGAAVQTTWYPIDAALVPIVAQRIARHLVQVAPSIV